jgi:hypothetical protein
MKEQPEPWHLDKKVPLALIVTLVLQTFAAVWWASGLSQRVASLEALTANSQDMLERTVRIETRVDGMKEILARIEKKLDAAPP